MFQRKFPHDELTKTPGDKMQFTTLEPVERLVLVGFRCWYAGYETGDLNFWEMAWNEYARELGPKAARPVVAELSKWVRAVRGAACRDIGYMPFNCTDCSRDEACALSLIAACQYGDKCLAKVKAYDLLENGIVDPVIETAGQYAGAMIQAGQILSPRSLSFNHIPEVLSRTLL